MERILFLESGGAEPGDDKDEFKPFWEEELVPASTPQCLLSSLEEIEIHNLSSRGIVIEDGMKVVAAYLLEVGIVLK
ncbi:unnamed protein product [Linum trigynum]|uniref:FBD domain-containing protein n=1 Tax=Linum trigynum TaxID=586398 RepID=A0AAV2FX87_9ROSI